jgi:tetratricopeptide (TPR) repeat protein
MNRLFLAAIAIFGWLVSMGGMAIFAAEPAIEDLLLPGMEKGIQGDYQGAIAEFTAVIRRHPNQPEAYYNRGIARAKIGDRQGAMADYNQSLRLNPNFAEVYAERGLLRWELGERQAAIADLQKAAELFRKQGNEAAYQDILEKIDELEK